MSVRRRGGEREGEGVEENAKRKIHRYISLLKRRMIMNALLIVIAVLTVLIIRQIMREFS